MVKKKSILFVRPAYHYSFLLRDEFKKKGWRADVFITPGFPSRLLYSREGIRFPYNGRNIFIKAFFGWVYFIFFMMRYRYFLIYGGCSILSLMPRAVREKFNKSFSLDLSLAKFLGKRIIYQPSGCRETETRENFSKLDNGRVCNNCGWGENVCNDRINIRYLKVKARYGDIFLGRGLMPSSHFKETHVKYQLLDLDLWRPGLEVPDAFRLKKTKRLRILHAFVKKNREDKNRNIKGSPYVLRAVNRLLEEGYPVQCYYLNDVPLREMIYYQSQADIIVEQLFYGWWGSTGVEAMSLGKPVVCYLRPEWKEFFFKTFPEYTSLPIVEADVENIYDVLKNLVIDKELRERKGRESRAFAERHFDIKKNTKYLENILLETEKSPLGNF